MTGILLDLRHSFRSLRKTPAIFLVSVVTIALGVGANTAMFSVFNAVVLSPLPYAAPERLVAPWPEKRWSVSMLQDVTERVESYEAISASTSAFYTLLGDGSAESVRVMLAMASHFDVLGVRPQLGGGFVAGDATASRGPVVVISHRFWQQRFGGAPDVVGRVIRLAGNGLTERTIVGVLPPDFWPATPDAWVPIVTTPGQPGAYGSYGLDAVARLKPGVSVQQASQEMRGLVDDLALLHPTQFREARYSPVDVVPRHETLVRNVRPQLLIALGAVGFILLIACTNVANLLLARAQMRRREVAVQLALGCSGGRIVRQVIAESLLMGIIGGAVGLAAAAFALPAVIALIGDQFPRAATIQIDPVVLAFALGISLLAGFVFGTGPAVRALRSAPGEIMRSTAGRGQSEGRHGRRASDALVIAQVALCLVLLAGAGLMLKSLWQLTRLDPGFDPSDVLTMRITLPPVRYDEPETRAALRRRLLEEVRAVPGIAAAGLIDDLPLGDGSTNMTYRVDGQELPPGASQVVSARVVTPGYFEVMRIPLLQGRMLGADDPPATGANALLANEAFARLHWPTGDALGARVLFGDGEPLGTIVGIVRDVRQQNLATPSAPEIYVSASQSGWPTSTVLAVRGVQGVPAQQAVVSALHAVEPEIAPRNIRAMETVLWNAAGSTRFYARLLTGFALVALVLGIVGVYGVISYAVSRRTGELGVRLALGATGRDLLTHVIVRAMVPVGIGVGVGLAAALLLTRLLASVVYEVRVTDPWVLGVVGAVLTAAALGAALVPALRAARINPIRAMQGE
jgi:predicted permease